MVLHGLIYGCKAQFLLGRILAFSVGYEILLRVVRWCLDSMLAAGNFNSEVGQLFVETVSIEF